MSYNSRHPLVVALTQALAKRLGDSLPIQVIDGPTHLHIHRGERMLFMVSKSTGMVKRPPYIGTRFGKTLGSLSDAVNRLKSG